MSLPHYYTTLAPFRELFGTGHPILTYHHVGPRPRGVRLKGLYVSPKLFARQMSELAAAGFSTNPYQGLNALPEAAHPKATITFDDGFCDIFQHALPVLQRHRFRAVVFLVADLLGRTNEWQQRAGDVVEPLMDKAQVRDWLAAGHLIGSHTRTHPHLTRLSAEAAREEIAGSRRSLEDRFGVPIEHFCYPYGDSNERVRDSVIEAGYRTACLTHTGINPPGSPPHELKRFTARYRSRSWRNLWAFIRTPRS